MIFIPAIDIIEGSCVRLTQGDFGRKTVYEGDPVDLALRFQDEGAARLHIVDLDAARRGDEGNLQVIERIVGAVGMPVQVGGGVRTRDRAARLLEAGVRWLITGTILIREPDLAASLASEFGASLIAGIDAQDGTVRITGWTETAGKPAVDVALQAQHMGYGAVAYTDIARDGTLQGPNLAAVGEVARALSIPVVAAGGISSLDDVRAVRELEPEGVQGVIAGKAIYEGRISVRDACAALRQPC
jgi:phosphoribosylformimino-5-aminoimidazole carboxamide ribotide isomerase